MPRRFSSLCAAIHSILLCSSQPPHFFLPKTSISTALNSTPLFSCALSALLAYVLSRMQLHPTVSAWFDFTSASIRSLGYDSI